MTASLAADYRRLRESVGAVADVYRAVSIAGTDARRFLQGVLSADVASAEEGTVLRSLLLTPKGRLVAHLRVAVGEDRIVAITDAAATDDMVDVLERFRFRVDARIDPIDAVCTLLYGPGATGACDLAPGRWRDEGARCLIDVPAVHPGARRILVVGGRTDVPPVDPAAYAAVRIEDGEPISGVDVDVRSIPHETGLVDGAVSFTKGCYLGQELVSRIETRGHVNRALRGIVAAGGAPIAAGTTVQGLDRDLGTVTSSAVSPERGAIGMAMVRVEALPGTEVRLQGPDGSREGTVVALPMR